MHRLFACLIGSMSLLAVAGCGGSSSDLPPNPTVDNRPAETKEADDGMAKNAAKVNSSLKH